MSSLAEDCADLCADLGADTALIEPTPGTPTALIADAHAAGLKVAAWTFRAEDIFVPTDYRGDLPGWIRRFYDLGVDAGFSDFPGVAVRTRDGG